MIFGTAKLLRSILKRVLARSKLAVLAVVAALIVLTSGTALAITYTTSTRATLKLNKPSYVATALTKLASNAAGAVLTLDTDSTDSSATPLSLLTETSSQAPMTVNSDTKVDNLNADKLDGKDSTEFLASDGKAADATHADHADSADTAGSTDTASSASWAANAAHADKASDSDKLGGKASTQFLASDGKAADADKLDGRDSTDFALKRTYDWHYVGTPEAPFDNGWVSADSPRPSFYKDSLGTIHLRGLVKNGFMNSVIFRLPCGYGPIPDSPELYPTVTQSSSQTYVFGAVQIGYTNMDPSGNGNTSCPNGGMSGWVMAVAGTTPYFSLSGITFRAADA